jgi:hypothetical protein
MYLISDGFADDKTGKVLVFGGLLLVVAVLASFASRNRNGMILEKNHDHQSLMPTRGVLAHKL